MCAAVEVNVRDYIRTGQPQVINRGIAEHNGQLEFWVCDDVSVWSSFHRDIASRNGAKHHAIIVNCIRISDIVGEFGVADYMKIDIEGNDRVCIVDLTSATAPKYISIEMDHSHGDQDIKRLFDLGYRGFKVICQNDSWRQVTTRNLSFYDPVAHRPFTLRCWRKMRKVSTRWLSGAVDYRIRLLADAMLPFNQRCRVFTRFHSFSPARAALRSQSNAAALLSCATSEGAIGWHL